MSVSSHSLRGSLLREVADIGFETVRAVDALSFTEDGVVGSEEQIVEKLE